MNKTFATMMLVGVMGSLLGGCAYGGVAAVGTDKVVIAKNNAFLFGILNKVYVCKVADTGVSACASAEAP
ncbi:MAG: hypothetical protein MUF64_15610 [Polyangiaceae bacterium]|jgi:hypothetical protein|nr:hypothetical protein [Polyangiaceae bacterium]